MGSKQELKELKKLNEKYLDNNIDLARALNTKKEQIADLENQIRDNFLEIFALHKFKRENAVLKAELVAKCGQNEKMQAELKQSEEKLIVWRSLFTELMKFNTGKFMEAMQMIGVLPVQNGVAQQTLATQQSVEHNAKEQIDKKPFEENQIEKKQPMEFKIEKNPPDQMSTEIKATELSCVHETTEISSIQGISEISTADNLINYLEETLTPSTLYPLINVNKNDLELEFSDDSITQPFIAMASNPTNNSMSFDMPTRSEMMGQTMPCDTQIESFEVPNQSKTASFEVTNASRIELLAASIVEDRPSTPIILLTKSSEMNDTKDTRKSDENFLTVPKITMQRKRLSQKSLLFGSDSMAFHTKSPRLSNKIDQNTSLALNSSMNLTLSDGRKSQSLVQITEKSPEKPLASPAMKSNSHKPIIKLAKEKTPTCRSMQDHPTNIKLKKTPSKIPRYEENLKGRNMQNHSIYNDERSPLMKFIPISGHSNGEGQIKIPSFSSVNNRNTQKKSPLNDDVRTSKATLACSSIQLSLDNTMDRMDEKRKSPKKQLQLNDDVLKSERLSIDSEDTNNMKNDNVPIANRRPTRRAAPKDLREPLLKEKMRRESKRIK